MTDEQKLTFLLKVLKEHAETPHCYDREGDDYIPTSIDLDAFGDGIDCGEIMFARTMLECIGVEFEYPVMKEND